MRAKVLLGEMSREQLRAVAADTTLVIPVAAVEQHAPDLPVTVDVLACETIARRAATIASATVPVCVAPIEPFGYSPHHRPYPGVFSLRAETLIAVLRDLGESAVHSGFRRIFFLNGHGGNDEIIKIAAREVSNVHECLTGAASYWSLATSGWHAINPDGSLRVPGHAGDFEASIVLALRPDLVDAEHPAPHKGTGVAGLPETAVPMFTQRDRSMQRIEGYTDRSPRASAELGRQILDIAEREVARALVQFHESYR